MTNEDDFSPETILRRCNKLKEKLDEIKRNKSEMVGRRQQIFKQLKDQFGINSLEEAHEKLKLLDGKIHRRNRTIAIEYSTLSKKLGELE